MDINALHGVWFWANAVEVTAEYIIFD